MPARKTRVAKANAAVEEELEGLSDEADVDAEDDESSDEFDTGSRLRQPLSYNRSLMELYQLLKDERYMNINPDYQRDVVWSESRMIHLIDSLFNNYYVPPLIFKVISGVKPGTTERRRWRTCIDGKQRLTTIRRFFEGEIPYIDNKRQKWFYCDPPGSTARTNRKLLPDEEKEFINNVQIVNIEFELLTDEQEEDMFQRVQLGVPLTFAEKLSAYTGELPSFINDLRSAYSNIPSLVGTKRSNDFRLITSLLYLMYQRLEEENLRLAHSQQTLKRFLEDKSILTPTFRDRVRKVFSKYNGLIQSYKDVFTHSFEYAGLKMRKFSPVEFLGVGVMLYIYPDRPTRVLAEDIKAFREFMRDNLRDLRTNAPTWVHVMNFVDRLEDSRGHYPREKGSRTSERAYATNGVPVSSRKNTAFNPPSPDKQFHTQRTTVYNELQQQAIQARLAIQQREQREAFNRIPPSTQQGSALPYRTSRTRGPDYAGGVQERSASGATKRRFDGVPVKRERGN